MKSFSKFLLILFVIILMSANRETKAFSISYPRHIMPALAIIFNATRYKLTIQPLIKKLNDKKTSEIERKKIQKRLAKIGTLLTIFNLIIFNVARENI